MLTLIMWHNRFSKNENEAVEAHIPRHWDSKTKKPGHRDSKAKKRQHRETETISPQHRDSKTFFQRTKSQDIEIPRLKNHDIKIPRLKSHDIEFPQILTLMPPDTPNALSCVGQVTHTFFNISRLNKSRQYFKMVDEKNNVTFNISENSLRAHLHETQSELKPIWNLKLLWNVIQFTWQFT